MRHYLVLFLFAYSSLSIAQKVDTIIYAEGKIINAATKEAIAANLSYQSLPYANKVGALVGSTYSFALFDREKYSITVQANGFQVYKATVDPAMANSDRKVINDIELVVNAVKAEESIHTVGKVIPLNNLIFAQNSDKISASSHAQLNDVAKMLHDNPKMIIQIEGHTDVDNKQTAKLNMKLSEQRVEAVRDYLLTKGVVKSKVKTKAFGGTRPIYTGSNAKERAQNRRVEARILEN
jgi:outer membrane protein OmpA-like peptidoglycan-associated protein